VIIGGAQWTIAYKVWKSEGHMEAIAAAHQATKEKVDHHIKIDNDRYWRQQDRILNLERDNRIP